MMRVSPIQVEQAQQCTSIRATKHFESRNERAYSSELGGGGDGREAKGIRWRSWLLGIIRHPILTSLQFPSRVFAACM